VLDHGVRTIRKPGICINHHHFILPSLPPLLLSLLDHVGQSTVIRM
jgi:hypothetical protein